MLKNRYWKISNCFQSKIHSCNRSHLSFIVCFSSFLRWDEVSHIPGPGLVTFKQSGNNNVASIFNHLAAKLFCGGHDNVAIMGWKELIHSRLYTKRGGIKAVCLSRGPLRCTLIRKRWKMTTGVFLGGPSLVCSTTKTIMPPLNTGSVTERPRKGFLHADERRGRL